MESRESSGQPWAIRDGESARQYAAFLHYIDAAETRSLEATAKATGYGIAQVKRLSVRHEWAFRSDQWDAFVAHQKVSVREEQAKAQAELEASSVATMARIAHIGITRLLKQVQDDESVIPGWTTIREFLSDTIRLSRLLRGVDQTPEEREREVSDAIKQLADLVSRKKRKPALKPAESE